MNTRLELIIMNTQIGNKLIPSEIKNYMRNVDFSDNYPFHLMLITVKEDILKYLLNPNVNSPFNHNSVNS